jgi:HEAT repeat protein
MKQFKIFLLALCLLPTIIFAQQKNDVRTVNTKVADLLMKLPAQNSATHNEAMKELASLGKEGIQIIASKLVSPGKGNDAAMRYAISGIAKYAGEGNDISLKRTLSLALINSLTTAKDNEVRDFLLQEAQYVAGDEAVPIIKKYLTNNRLSDPATRLLLRVGNNNAYNALMNVASTTKGSPQLNAIKALGDAQYAPAANVLLQLWSKATDGNFKKILLRSLAQIGDISATSVLENAAKNVNYTFNAEDATGSYLVFLQQQLKKNNTAYVEKSAQNLLDNTAVNEVVKSAALSLLSKAAPQQTLPKLLAALRSSDNQFRGTALQLLGENYSQSVSSELQKAITETNDTQLQSEIIYLLAQKKDKSALPSLINFLNNNDSRVQRAAINAVAKVGGIDAINPLIDLLQKSDNAVAAATENALLTIAGNKVQDAAAKAVNNASDAAKIFLIDIIKQRRAAEYSELIFDATKSNNPALCLAAAKALSNIATEKDAEKITTLLNNAATPDLATAYQQALTSALSGKTKSERVTTIQKFMENSNGNEHLYYNALAAVGGKEALNIVWNGFKNGTPQQKNAAIKSLASWSDDTALDALYQIAKTNSGEVKGTALSSFIAGINTSRNTTDQKVLMFRNAMELAATLAQKRNILNGISANSTLQSLIFVSKYFDDNDLQQTAVQAVINIVLDHNELYGKNVEAIANRAIELNKDTESDYLKQALIRHLAALPKEEGFVPMFNGKDLTGWKGLVENPVKRAKMSAAELTSKQKEADEQMRKDWKVENGVLVFEGKGYNNLVSEKMYQDFEMFVDWRMEPKGDGGVYLRGSPQVQTWDTSRVEAGAQVGSGGLYNNQKNKSTPLKVADNPINEWNTFRIKMIGDKVTVYLNGELVTDNVTLENYWDRSIPIFDKEAIELQAHGTRLEFRDVYVKEIPRPKPYEVSAEEKKEGFVPMFNGVNLDGWMGNTVNYYAQNGMIISDPAPKAPASMNKNIYTEKEYSDFIVRFEFQLTSGANNGLGIRTPTEGDAAYVGMELQILDNEAEIYKDLKIYQYHGSVYGVIPALRGYLKPVGEWNYQEVKAVGNHITITLNGKIILDGDIAKASKNNTETADGQKHPGLLNKSGHIGFLGHGSFLKFRNLRIKDLGK